MRERTKQLIKIFQNYINVKANLPLNAVGHSNIVSNDLGGAPSSPSGSSNSEISTRSQPSLQQKPDRLQMFIDNFENIIIRNKYLWCLRNETKEEILNAGQYNAIGEFTKNNIDLIRELLAADNDNSAPLHIGKKEEQRDKRFKGELPRTIEIDRKTLEIYVLPSRKLADGNKDPRRARSGTYKKVTARVLLNPINDRQVLTNTVTKSQKLDRSVMQEIEIEQKVYGAEVTGIGNPYPSKGRPAVRTTDTKALCALDVLANPDTAKSILMQDKNYNITVPEAKNKILIRLMLDILECMGKTHAAGIIHNDIKAENILVYLDEKKQLRAKIIDFGLSVDVTGAIRSASTQPVATATHASPEVVAFVKYRMTSITPLRVFYDSLYADFFDNRYYGCEKYKQGQPTLTEDQRNKFINNKCDTKDDMWAVGVTLYTLITGAYPTDNQEFDRQYLSRNLRYMHVDTALAKFPLLAQLKPLILDGLLAPTREGRPDAVAAKETLNQLVRPNALKRNRIW